MKSLFSMNYLEIINNIMDYYYSKFSAGYIPALYNENKIYIDGEELYCKLVIAPKEYEVKKTWIKENLSNIIDESHIHNILVEYNYKFNKIYGLSPYLLSDDNVIIEDQDNSGVMNLIYNELSKINKPKILIKTEYGVDLCTKFLENYVDSKYTSGSYNLFVDVEYSKRISLEEYKNINDQEEGVSIPGGYALFYKTKNQFSDNEEFTYRMLFSKKIDISRLINDDNKNKIDSSIKVISLDDGSVRDLNTSNYNDDMDAGFVVFSKEIIDILKKYYYFYDLMLLPKNLDIHSPLIDVVGEYVVFWEGEFNQIPQEIVNAIKEFNIQNKININNIISEAMCEWQLMASWNYVDKLLPNMKLAYQIRYNYLELAKENELDFCPPKNIDEYSSFIIKLLKILNLNFKKLKLDNTKINMLKDIIDKKYLFNDYNHLYMNYQGFCNLILETLKNE